MKIEPLSKVMGAEVAGVDLNGPLTAAERDQLYQAFLDHLVLCVRGQAFADRYSTPSTCRAAAATPVTSTCGGRTKRWRTTQKPKSAS